MFLVGMWHGASWNFVIYSNLHGLAMLFNRWNRLRERSGAKASSIALVIGAALLLAGVSGGLGASVLHLALPEALTLAGPGCLALLDRHLASRHRDEGQRLFFMCCSPFTSR